MWPMNCSFDEIAGTLRGSNALLSIAFRHRQVSAVNHMVDR